MADSMASGGYLDAGYNQVSIDDCWERIEGRDDGKLVPNSDRFPSGIKALGDYIHGKGIRFGIYSDEGTFYYFSLFFSRNQNLWRLPRKQGLRTSRC